MNTPDVAFPYRPDGRGRTAAPADNAAHLRDLIEQLLFTAPGERVNRPDFGCGLMQLVFAPNSVELAATLQALVQASLQQWLGQRARIDEVRASAEDATLTVFVRYTPLGARASSTASFTRDLGA